MKNYNQVINDLKKTIATYEAQGITVKPLNDAINDLDKHSKNINIIEDNIEAIREEVIDKIKIELDENKRAGRFSVFGAYLGGLGLILSIISIVFTLYEKINPKVNSNIQMTELTRSVQSINTRLSTITPEYTIKNNEIECTRWDKIVILDSKQGKLEFELDGTYEGTVGEQVVLFSRINIYLNSRQIGNKSLKEIFSISGKYNLERIDKNHLQLVENDEFIIFNKYKFKVSKILNKDVNIRAIADSKDAVYIKKIDF